MLFLEKAPKTVNIQELKEHLTNLNGVIDVHHIHIWSMDGQSNYATMHIVAKDNVHDIKEMVREELKEHGISHATLELEAENEHCDEKRCVIESNGVHPHHHHH